MPDFDHQPASSSAYATFHGHLDQARVTHLFGHRSLKDRAATFTLSIVLAPVVFAIVWFVGAMVPLELHWVIASAAAIGVFVHGQLLQFAFWHSRRWLQWNTLLVGRYRVVLTDDHVDIQAAQFAWRFPYHVFAMVDSGLSCVRLGLDATAYRALLLPIADCQPPRTVDETVAYLRDRIRDAKLQPLELTHVSDRSLPLPLELNDQESRIELAGDIRQGDILQAVEDGARKSKLILIQRTVCIVIGVCVAGVVAILGISAAAGQFPRDGWLQAGTVAVVLFFVVIAAVRRASAKAEIRADPDAAAGHLQAWISPFGVSAFCRHAATSLVWSACDRVEASDQQIVAQFWRGDFLVIGRNTFRSEADFQQAVEWIRAASAERQPR